jgi:hypothetical protein
MASPDDLVVRLLREIQGTLADHSHRFGRLDERLGRMERRLDEVNEGMVTALGLAGHAHVRSDGIQRQLDELNERVAKLEEKA